MLHLYYCCEPIAQPGGEGNLLTLPSGSSYCGTAEISIFVTLTDAIWEPEVLAHKTGRWKNWTEGMPSLPMWDGLGLLSSCGWYHGFFPYTSPSTIGAGVSLLQWAGRQRSVEKGSRKQGGIHPQTPVRCSRRGRAAHVSSQLADIEGCLV